jgi:hypothetical protein
MATQNHTADLAADREAFHRAFQARAQQMRLAERERAARLPVAINAKACEATREAVREVMRAVNAGDCIGVAVVAIYRGREYELITAGEAARDPTFARGAVADLADSLAKQQHRANRSR